MKREVERRARQRSCSEAEVIRQAIQDAVARPKPRPGIFLATTYGEDTSMST